MRGVGLLLLIAAAVLGWLSVGDRMSPTAVAVVEWDTRAGVPVYQIAAVAGVVLLALGTLLRIKPKAAPVRQHRPQAAPSAMSSHTDLTEALRAARGLTWEVGATFRVQPDQDAPFVLQMSQMPPASEKRCLEILAGFLDAIPLPPRVEIVFVGSQSRPDTHHHRVRAALRPLFPPDSFQLLRQGAQVAILFRNPDPVWNPASRLSGPTA